MEDQEDILTILKILIIGESNVGKSSLLVRFTEDEFNEEIQNTVGMDYKTKKINLNGDMIKLAIWDTAGQERFRTLTPNYYRDGQGAILVYDVTDRSTFFKLENWLNELHTYTNKSNIVKMVVGNKIDLPNRQVTTEEGIQFARRHKTLYIESSAKTADNVKSCFEELVEKVLQTPGLWESHSSAFAFNKSAGGPRQRLGKRGMQLTDDYEPENSYSCYCSLI